MKYEEMTLEQSNAKLQEIRAEVIVSFGGRPHTGKETMDLLARKWAAFKGVPFVEVESKLPSMVPEAPALKQVLPDGIPGPVRVSPTGERTPAPAKVDDPAANVGQGKWTENKVPDIKPMDAVTSPAPPPPAKAVRTPP